MSSHIHLIVSFRAETISDDTYIPDTCSVEEALALTFPTMDAKFVMFPKLVEGATERVISQHADRVGAYLRKQAEDKRKADERRQLGLWSAAQETSPYGADTPVLDGQALLTATDEQIAAAVVEAVAEATE